MRVRVTFELEWDQLTELSKLDLVPLDVERVKEPSGPKARPKAAPARTPASETDGGKAIMRLLEAHPQDAFRIADFTPEFTRLGYSPKSAGTIVAALAREGKAKRLEPGLYAHPSYYVSGDVSEQHAAAA